MNELALYQYTAAALTVAPVPRSGNYTICAPNGAPATLRRGVDFGMIRRRSRRKPGNCRRYCPRHPRL